MSATVKGFSGQQFNRQMGLGRNETTLRMMHKIRLNIGKREALFTLKDMLEFDESYFGIVTPKQWVKEKMERRKGSQRKGGL